MDQELTCAIDVCMCRLFPYTVLIPLQFPMSGMEFSDADLLPGEKMSGKTEWDVRKNNNNNTHKTPNQEDDNKTTYEMGGWGWVGGGPGRSTNICSHISGSISLLSCDVISLGCVDQARHQGGRCRSEDG